MMRTMSTWARLVRIGIVAGFMLGTFGTTTAGSLPRHERLTTAAHATTSTLFTNVWVSQDKPQCPAQRKLHNIGWLCMDGIPTRTLQKFYYKLTFNGHSFSGWQAQYCDPACVAGKAHTWYYLFYVHQRQYFGPAVLLVNTTPSSTGAATYTFTVNP